MILEVAYAYKSLRENWMDNTLPTISFAMAYPQTAARHISVKRTVHKQDDYSPQLIKYPFVAEKVEQVLNLNATGNITLGAIYLKENF